MHAATKKLQKTLFYQALWRIIKGKKNNMTINRKLITIYIRLLDIVT